MANKFDIKISAQDNTSATLTRIAESIDRLNQSFGENNKQTDDGNKKNKQKNEELTRTEKILERIKRTSLGRRVSGQGGVMSDIFDIFSDGKKAKQAAEAGAEAEDLVGKMGLLGRGFQALAITAAGVVYGTKLASKWATDAQSLENFSHVVGISTDTLQKWNGVAKIQGIPMESIMGDMQNFGILVRNVQAGDSSASRAAQAFKLLGIDVQYGKNGLMDFNEALNATVKGLDTLKSPQTRQLVTEALSLGSLTPLVGRPTGYVAELERQAAEAARPNAQVLAAAESAKKRNKSNLMWEAGKRNIGDTFLPVLDLWSGGKSIIGGTVAGEGAFFDRSTIPTGGRGAGVLKNRGMQQNNPMNLRQWEGFPINGGFSQFPDMDTGLQKGAIQLRRYGAQGVNDLSSIVNKFTPPNENKTPKYIADLSRLTGFSANEKLDMNSPSVLSKLVGAQSQLETGYKPSGQQLNNAVNQALQVNIQVNAPSGVTATATVTTATGQNLQPRISHSMPLIPE